MLPNLGLPFPTRFLASPARSHGGFGLVGAPFTNAYQPSDLGGILAQNTITNHYHRTGGLAIIDCYNGLGTVIDCGEHPTGLPI